MALVEPALTGYMIQRPTHLEVNVKRPLIHKLISNDNSMNDIPVGLSVALSQSYNTLIDNSNIPNLTFLKNKKLDEGVKIKFKGVILQDDITSFEKWFSVYVIDLIKFLQKSKPKVSKPKLVYGYYDHIRKGLRYDAFGWCHADDCSCGFTRYQPTRLCLACDDFAVKLHMGDKDLALKPTGEGRNEGLK